MDEKGKRDFCREEGIFIKTNYSRLEIRFNVSIWVKYKLVLDSEWKIGWVFFKSKIDICIYVYV